MESFKIRKEMVCVSVGDELYSFHDDELDEDFYFFLCDFEGDFEDGRYHSFVYDVPCCDFWDMKVGDTYLLSFQHYEKDGKLVTDVYLDF